MYRYGEISFATIFTLALAILCADLLYVESAYAAPPRGDEISARRALRQAMRRGPGYSLRDRWDFTIEVPADMLHKAFTSNRERKVRGSVGVTGDNAFIIAHHGPESDDYVRDWGYYGFRISGSERHKLGDGDALDIVDRCLLKARYARRYQNMFMNVFAFGLHPNRVFVSAKQKFRRLVRAEFSKRLRAYRADIRAARGDRQRVRELKSERRRRLKLSAREMLAIWNSVKDTKQLRRNVWLSAKGNSVECNVFYWTSPSSVEYVPDEVIEAEFAHEEEYPNDNPDDNLSEEN